MVRVAIPEVDSLFRYILLSISFILSHRKTLVISSNIGIEGKLASIGIQLA